MHSRPKCKTLRGWTDETDGEKLKNKISPNILDLYQYLPMPAEVSPYTPDDSLLLQFLHVIFYSVLCNVAYVRCNLFTTGIRMNPYIFENCDLHL